MFTIQDNWTNRRISREKTNCEQNLELFRCKNNLISACLQDMERGIPSELIANLCNENDELMLSANPASLIKHVEDNHDIFKPNDISAVIKKPSTNHLMNQ